MTSKLPNGSEFFRDFSIRFGLLGVAAAAAILLYIAVLLRLPAEQTRELWWSTGAVALCITPLMMWWQRRFMAGLTRCLDRCASGRVTTAELKLGFATAVDVPRRCALFSLSNYVAGTVLVVGVMFARFDDFSAHAAILLVVAALSGGMLVNVVQFFVLKRILAPIREALAEDLPDPRQRDELVRRLPLVQKITVGLVAVALVPVVFTVFLAQSRASSSAEAVATRLQRAMLARAAEELRAAPEGDVARVLEDVQRAAAGFGVPARLQLVSDAGRPVALTSSERARVLEAAARGGDALVRGDVSVVDWRRVTVAGRERILAAATPRDRLDAGGLAWMYTLVVLGTAVVALLVAWLMARDVGHATRSLEEQAVRVADGDLGPGRLLESEDELGAAGRAFAQMVAGLRTTVGVVVRAADRVDATGALIRDTAGDVADGARAQVRGTQSCVASVEAVKNEELAISKSARALLDSAEESSSSVLQMTAAGDELHETASIVSSKVDEVASSIEQSARRIAEVNENTAALSSAAEETSSSMEEMAASMRQVDTTAEETARLSGEVVRAAERGQQKVRETVHGMESIRLATDSVERVIHGLGDRVMKIGAVLEVMGDIANRTNLLALNASIIAAQAGEHGRSFSVVAAEIAELATRVRSSGEEIGQLVRSVQQESENAIGAIASGAESVKSGVSLANEADASLDEITAAARQSGERSREIVAAVREQSSAAGHVVGRMEQVAAGLDAIRRATEEQSGGHEAIAAASRSMKEVTQMLWRTTEEQKRSLEHIRESIEGVRDHAEVIHDAVESQGGSCAKSVELLEELASHAVANETRVRQMQDALRTMLEESESLREDVHRFHV